MCRALACDCTSCHISIGKSSLRELMHAENVPPPSHQMFGQMYDQLKVVADRLMRRESQQYLLQSTALVHEAYVRLASRQADIYDTQADFLAAATEVMRRILIDSARARRSLKRGGSATRVDMGDEVLGTVSPAPVMLDLDDAITQLERQDPELATIVKLRFYAGLSGEQIAMALSISRSTVDRRWAFAKAWLAVRLSSTLALRERR